MATILASLVLCNYRALSSAPDGWFHSSNINIEGTYYAERHQAKVLQGIQKWISHSYASLSCSGNFTTQIDNWWMNVCHTVWHTLNTKFYHVDWAFLNIPKYVPCHHLLPPAYSLSDPHQLAANVALCLPHVVLDLRQMCSLIYFLTDFNLCQVFSFLHFIPAFPKLFSFLRFFCNTLLRY